MVTSVDPLCKHYNECGCEVSSCCIECPLPVCKYEEEQGIQTVRANLRALRIAHLIDEGRTIGWIMQVMGVSERTVYRALAARNTVTAPLTESVRSDTINVAAQAIAGNGRHHD